METTKHTPTPYAVAPSSNPKNGKAWRDIVATTTEFSPAYVGEALEHDAEFIVRACNAHDALVEALQAVVVLYDQGQLVIDGDNENGRDPVIEAARAALSAAGVTT